MSRNDRNGEAEVDSEEEDLSELEQRNLDSILVLFPYRKKLETTDPIDDETFLKVKNALTCPVCLDIYKDPVFIKKCLHRFCRVCIEKVIRSQDNKTCPACRIQLGSKRLLRNDKWTEAMIKKVFHNLKEFQQKENVHYTNFYRTKTKEFKEQGRYPNRRRNTRSSGPETTQQLQPSSPLKVKKEAPEESKPDKMPVRVADRTRKALEVHKNDNNIINADEKKPEKLIEKPKKTKEIIKRPKIEKALPVEKPKKTEKEPPKPKKDSIPKKSVIEISDEPEDDIEILPKGSSPKLQKKRKPSVSENVIVIDGPTDVETSQKLYQKIPMKAIPEPLTYTPDLFRASGYPGFFPSAYSPYGMMMPPLFPSPMDYLSPIYSQYYSNLLHQMPQQPQNKQFESMLKKTPNGLKGLSQVDGTGNEQKITLLSQNDRKQYGDFFSTISSQYSMINGFPKSGK